MTTIREYYLPLEQVEPGVWEAPLARVVSSPRLMVLFEHRSGYTIDEATTVVTFDRVSERVRVLAQRLGAPEAPIGLVLIGYVEDMP